MANEAAMIGGPLDGLQATLSHNALAALVGIYPSEEGIERIAFTFGAMSSAGKTMMFLRAIQTLSAFTAAKEAAQ